MRKMTGRTGWGVAAKPVLAIAMLSGATACAPRRPQSLQPLSVEEYPVPWADAFPSDVVVDEEGRVWFTDRLVHVIGVFDLETSRFDSLRTPTRNSAPYGILRAPDGAIWYAASNAGRLGRVDVKRRRIEEHEIPGARGGPHLIAWLNGTIWFSLRESYAFGRYDTRTKETRLFNALERDKPYSVAVAPNGHVWFDVLQGWRLYDVDPRTDSVRIHELSEPPPPGDPWGHYAFRDSTGRLQTRILRNAADTVALDAERRRAVQQNRLNAQARRMTIDRTGQIWVADYGRNRLVRYDPVTREMRAFASPVMASRPYGIAASESGHILFNETRANLIVVLDPVSGQRSTIVIPTAGATVRHLVIDEKRLRVWLPTSDGGRLGLLRFAR